MEPPRLRQTVLTAYGGRRYQLEDRRHYHVIVGGVRQLVNEWQRRNPRNLRNSWLQGNGYVHELLTEMGGDTRLRETTGLNRQQFDCFVDKVTTTHIVQNGFLITIQEACAFNLAIMHLRLSNRQAQECFQHLGATITKCFRNVLMAVDNLRGTYITGESFFLVSSLRLNLHPFLSPWFKPSSSLCLSPSIHPSLPPSLPPPPTACLSPTLLVSLTNTLLHPLSISVNFSYPIL